MIFAFLLLLLFLYRYDEECSEAVPNFLKLQSVFNWRQKYAVKLFEVWKLQCTFGSLFYDQSCALETCFIITWQISEISTQFGLFLLLYHMWQRHFRRVYWQFNILIRSSLLHVYYLIYKVVIFNSFSRLVLVYDCLERFPL